MRVRCSLLFARIVAWFRSLVPGQDKHEKQDRARAAEVAALSQQLAASVAAATAREAEVQAHFAFLDSVLDSIAPDVFFVLDIQARVIRCNEAFSALFGWTRQEIAGASIARIFASEREFHQIVPPLIQRVRAQGHAHFEHVFVTRAQRQVRLDVHIAHLPAQHMGIVVARDITARAQMEHQVRAALDASERYRGELAAIFNTVQDALIVYDLRGQPLYMNHSAQQVFGAALLQRNIFHPDPQTRITTLDGKELLPAEYPIARILRGEPQEGTLLHVQPPGRSAIILALQATPLRERCGQIRGALAVMRDVTAERRNQRNADTLRAVAQACAAAAGQTAVAEAALTALMAGLRLSNGAIIARDSDRPGYARSLAYQCDPALPADERGAWQQTLAETPISAHAPLATLRVLATGEQHFGNPAPLARIAADSLAAPFHYGLAIPLHVAGDIFGVLALATTRSSHMWDAVDRELILAVADQVAIALHRAQLYEEARHLALFDPLTGLRNHRALQSILRQELGAGAAQGLPVSAIMLDIDHFRKFNEVYGHEVGDRALRVVAQAIQAALRGGDYAARYGGEEFVIVLPATDADHAQSIATGILAKIQAMRITQCARGGDVCVTASLGHATFPMHASAPASLLKAADLALYAAKRNGRNLVMAYSPLMLESNAHLLPAATLSSDDPNDISLPTGADLEMVQALITAIDLRDGYTAAHSDGVSRFAVAIAHSLGLPAEHVEALRLGGLIHDAGKIGVPDQILRKPGKLDAAEWVQMQAHTTMGEEILRPVEKLRHLLPLVRWHHERLDGSGYPDGLRGDQIPQLVRILSVADVFEAFTAERPYHPGRPAFAGLRLLHDEARLNRLDGAIVAIFEQILRKQGLIDDLAHGEQDLQHAA